MCAVSKRNQAIPNPAPQNQPSNSGPPPSNESVWDFKASHYVTAGLTVALLIVAWFQLCTYQRQADIMDKQVTIAATQNDIAESTGRAFLSPSIRIDDAMFIDPEKGMSGPKVSGYLFQPVAENTGNTPTNGLTFAGTAITCGTSVNKWRDDLAEKAVVQISPVQMVVFKTVDTKCQDFIKFPDAPPDPADMFKDSGTGRVFIGPHAKADVGGIGVTQDLLQYVNNKGGRWYLAGVLRYHDTFPKTPEHITKYCYVLAMALAGDGSLKPHAGLCAHWNCADNGVQGRSRGI